MSDSELIVPIEQVGFQLANDFGVHFFVEKNLIQERSTDFILPSEGPLAKRRGTKLEWCVRAWVLSNWYYIVSDMLYVTARIGPEDGATFCNKIHRMEHLSLQIAVMTWISLLASVHCFPTSCGIRLSMNQGCATLATNMVIWQVAQNEEHEWLYWTVFKMQTVSPQKYYCPIQFVFSMPCVANHWITAR